MRIMQEEVRTVKPRRSVLGVAMVATAALALTACGSGSAKQVSGSSKQVLYVSLQGLGAETTETEAQMKQFEAANPNITVKPLILSPDASTLYQQLSQRFVSGSTSPDVIISDVTWTAEFAKAGWVDNLSSFHPNMSQYFPAQVTTAEYNGTPYAVPWFSNAEGLYYRTDLVKTPPTTTQQLISDAQQAMSKDKSLKEGIAFEGDKYEGAITAWQGFLGAFGGKLDTGNLNTPANTQALQFEHDLIYKYKLAPTAVTTWQEQQVENAWTSGQTAFAYNWPYMINDSAKAAPVKGKVGFAPFPSNTGTPAASLGGDDLMVNAKSGHKAAAWKFIQFLSTTAQQDQRAIKTGDAPSVTSAWNNALYAGAPYFKQAQAVFKVTANRPESPVYPQISNDLQTMLSSVLANQQTPSAALAATAAELKQLGS
jgi:multiple sugar transport system substrate-binding protein